MCNIDDFNRETREYFDSLPKGIKEQIVLSGVQISNKNDLESLYRNMTAK